jgi:hypothetical protein
MGDVYCVLDPQAPDVTSLEAALRLARLLAVASARRDGREVDAEALREAVARIAPELDALRALKMRLTTIATASGAISAGLDQMRDAILARIGETEALLRMSPGSSLERPRS